MVKLTNRQYDAIAQHKLALCASASNALPLQCKTSAKERKDNKQPWVSFQTKCSLWFGAFQPAKWQPMDK